MEAPYCHLDRVLSSSELILRASGAIYHLNLFPEQISNNIIIVGDPERVPIVSKHFDFIEHEVSAREFVTHTGYLGNVRLSVVSSGIGTDNIDILLNEIDALHNICLANRTIKKNLTKLNIIRIGTSGSIQADLEVGEYIYSEYAIGLDGLIQYYPFIETVDCIELRDEFIRQTNWATHLSRPYVIKASQQLVAKFAPHFKSGITLTSPGFYAPQGRYLRVEGNNYLQNYLLGKVLWQGKKLSNYEMETSGIYGLSKLMGHSAITLCAIMANRVNKTFAEDPEKIIKKLIISVLEKLTG